MKEEVLENQEKQRNFSVVVDFVLFLFVVGFFFFLVVSLVFWVFFFGFAFIYFIANFDLFPCVRKSVAGVRGGEEGL